MKIWGYAFFICKTEKTIIWNDETKLKQKIQSQISIMFVGYFEMIKVSIND